MSEPWLTGPLLAPAGVTVPKGHTNIEPYLFITDAYGIYGSNWRMHSIDSTQAVNPVLILTHGLADRLDFQAALPYLFSFKNGHEYNSLGDINLLFGIQAIKSDVWPNLRITVGETFPSGRYQDLIAYRSGVDSTGAGAYQTVIGANFQKSLRLWHGRVLRTRLDFAFSTAPTVQVSGFNSYGGGFGTSGTIDPGDKYSVDLGLEFTLTQHWVPALDVVYAHQELTRFKGIAGTTATGMAATNGSTGYNLISLAPAMEYNFTPSFGVIAGAWFSVAGKGTADFTSAVIAVNYYI
ncbi:MAG: hypothetical protein A3F10_00425 [Coxiella sp. RIFCSPHIGHO2_12_FULL_42_15]|nr:MAG: hypothetical protein A3F10_00425 [Coxiella sp. RIFCSPHIGHO2_12_FULL_42_15]